MGKCKLSPKHRRVRKRGDSHSSGNDHKRGIRGHAWKGHGMDRECERCGEKSGSKYPGLWGDVKGGDVNER